MKYIDKWSFNNNKAWSWKIYSYDSTSDDNDDNNCCIISDRNSLSDIWFTNFWCNKINIVTLKFKSIIKFVKLKEVHVVN